MTTNVIRAHKVQDGKIVDTIVVGSLDALPGVLLVDAENGGSIGDLYDVETGVVTRAPNSIPVPSEVTMRQARLALHNAGLLDVVNTSVNQAGGAALIEWEYAGSVQRNNGLLQRLIPVIGITEAQLDTLFIAAANL